MNAKALLLSAVVLTLPVAALAHHGWSGQEDKVSVLEGTVQAVRYVNPHGQIEIVTPDSQKWTVTLAPLQRMQSRGLTEDKLVVGQKVRIEGNKTLDKNRLELKASKITVGGVTTNLMA